MLTKGDKKKKPSYIGKIKKFCAENLNMYIAVVYYYLVL
jgi:hypothetical protein